VRPSVFDFIDPRSSDNLQSGGAINMGWTSKAAALVDMTSLMKPSALYRMQGGGAINIGLDDFKGSGSCSTARPNATVVSVSASSFSGNTAKLQGGAIALQSGSLLLQVGHASTSSEMISHMSTGDRCPEPIENLTQMKARYILTAEGDAPCCTTLSSIRRQQLKQSAAPTRFRLSRIETFTFTVLLLLDDNQTLTFAVTQDSVLLRNVALGQAAGGAAGSGLGGGLYLEPTCLGGAGCKSAFALLNNTLLEHNTASQVQPASLRLPARVSACCLCTLSECFGSLADAASNIFSGQNGQGGLKSKQLWCLETVPNSTVRPANLVVKYTTGRRRRLLRLQQRRACVLCDARRRRQRQQRAHGRGRLWRCKFLVAAQHDRDACATFQPAYLLVLSWAFPQCFLPQCDARASPHLIQCAAKPHILWHATRHARCRRRLHPAEQFHTTRPDVYG